MNSTRTKIYLFITLSFAFFIFLACQNNKDKNNNLSHSEIQSIKEPENKPVFVHPNNGLKANPEELLKSLVYIQGNFGGVGSGFIIEIDGKKYILSANHVISFHDQTKFDLNFYHRERNQYPVEILGKDELLDISLLKFDPKEDLSDVPALKLGASRELKKLDPLLSLGNPWPTQFIIDSGKVIVPQSNIINQLNGTGNHPACLIHDCPTSKGSSGGPILNINGEVVAINQRFLPNNPGYIHYSGCESDAIKVVLSELQKKTMVKHWDLQILGEMRSNLNVHHLTIQGLKKVPKDPGLVIFALRLGSASDQAGLMVGDTVLTVDKLTIRSAQDFYYYLYVTPHDENFEPTFKIKREGKEITISVKKVPKLEPIPDSLDIIRDFLEKDFLNPEKKE